MKSVLTVVFASLLHVGALAQDVDANGVPRSLDFDRLLEQPGQQWSMPEIAQRAVQTVHLIKAADDRVDQAIATTQEARAAAIPRFNLRGRYTRLSQINNAPLVPLDIDFAAAEATLAQVQDPAAQELLGANLEVLQAISGDAIPVPRNRYNFRASVSYPLLALFLQILPGIRSAEHGESAQRFEANVVRNDVALEVIEIYMNHARARGSLAVAELAVRQAQENQAQAEALLRGGIGNRPDVLRFEARVAAAERGRAESHADVESTANALRTLLDIPGAGPLAFQERFMEVPKPAVTEDRDDLIEAAWKLRDEVQAIDALVQARRYAVRGRRGSMAPTLGVEAGADYARPNPLFIPPIDEFRTSWNVTAVANWSPDGTWAASRSKERAVAALNEAEEQRRQLKDLVRIEVVRSYAAYRASFESVRAAKRQVEAAEEAYDAKRRGFDVGVFDATEVIDAEVDANRARLALIDAAARLRVRESALRTAIGEHLWE
ncbi:MAG: TolC family protein [Myxococcota bacterium]